MVKLVAEGQAFQVDEKIEGVTNFFKDLTELEGKKQEIVLATFTKDDVSRLFQACKIADYKFKEVTKVNQSDASAYIAGLNDYFSKLTLDDLNGLYKLAKYLRITGLQNHIAAYFASKIHFKLNLTDYKEKKKQLGAKEELTPQRSRQLKEKYAFLN